MKKAILVVMLGIVMLPAVASAKPRPEKYSVHTAKTHPFFRFLIGK